MNTLSDSKLGFSAKRIALAVVALSVTTLLAITVSTDAFAKSNGHAVASSILESEFDSIPGSSTASDADSSLEGPLMASDPTFIVTDSLKGPLTEAGTDATVDTVLKGPLS